MPLIFNSIEREHRSTSTAQSCRCRAKSVALLLLFPILFLFHGVLAAVVCYKQFEEAYNLGFCSDTRYTLCDYDILKYTDRFYSFPVFIFIAGEKKGKMPSTMRLYYLSVTAGVFFFFLH